MPRAFAYPCPCQPMAWRDLCCCVPAAEDRPSLLLARVLLTGEGGWWISAPWLPGAQHRSCDKDGVFYQMVSQDSFMCARLGFSKAERSKIRVTFVSRVY